MKGIPSGTRQTLASAVILALSACSGGGGGGGTTPPPPYPDPADPSAFPTQADTEEGSSGNNTPASAGSLLIGTTTYHTIYPIGDVDWLAVSLTGGTQYEFSVDNVSYNGYPRMQIFASSDTTTPLVTDFPAEEWGYFANNPRIRYTPSASGTYYLKVADSAGGINSYTLSSRVFSDSDGDGYSPHYDCRDNGPNRYPWAPEIAGDGVDQSCSGYDWPDAANPDSFEPDNDFTTAGNLPLFKGDPWDIIYRGEIYAETHTLDINDVDVFKITVPPHTYHDIYDIETNGIAFDSKLYDASDLVTPVDALTNSAFIVYWLDNTLSDTATDYYLEVKATTGATGVYALGVGNGGSDADGDGYFTQSQGLGWDCNDNDSTVHAGAAELSTTDGIDSNCNGKDGS